ncbi:MAG: DUF1992 domain-containing protein [Thermodesulfovibrio sp.]|nr:DUF1992 domain-containing protein [Thermodesulfovibrio sp.]
MDIFIRIAEKRIEEAMHEGEFENLQNAGKPFVFEDETWIPEDLRIAYKVLKNAGCTPPELEARKEIIGLKELINTLDDDKERMKKIRELNFKIMRFNMMRKRPLCLEAFPDYEMRFFEKTID